MVLGSSVAMTRKSISIAIILIMSCIAPATAVIGFCAKMPCCSHEAAQISFAAEGADCCTTFNCYEAPPETLTKAMSTARAPITVPATTSNAVIVRYLDLAVNQIPRDEAPPPSSAERLSTLSILLI